MRATKAPSDQLFALWEMPMRLSLHWYELCFAMLPSHRLTRDEREDKAHCQLVVPEPLKTIEDHDLFA